MCTLFGPRRHMIAELRVVVVAADEPGGSSLAVVPSTSYSGYDSGGTHCVSRRKFIGVG